MTNSDNPILSEAAKGTAANKTPLKHALEGAGFVQDIAGGIETFCKGDHAAAAGDLAVGMYDVFQFAKDFKTENPLTTVMSMGFGWLIEHVGPIKDLLDMLTGNQDALDMTVQTWTKISEEVQKTAASMVESVNRNCASWSGPAVDTYRAWAQDQANTYVAISNSATAVAGAVDLAKSMLNGVRGFIRGLLADLLAELVWILLRYVPPTYPVALAVEGVPLIVSSTTRAMKVVRAFVEGMKELGARLTRLAGTVADLTRYIAKSVPDAARAAAQDGVMPMLREEMIKEMGVKYTAPKIIKETVAEVSGSTDADDQTEWGDSVSKEVHDYKETRVERTPTGGTRETGSLW
ncbi:hypothetical protein [Actinokineospora pegani]|uniref:hypothetical protein n=1 Tax=Actinokineospora pegani TaxID=2654637 RepID=UPI0012E9C0E6|nr:hypothetical protein [Actinokineospora pegani]